MRGSRLQANGTTHGTTDNELPVNANEETPTAEWFPEGEDAPRPERSAPSGAALRRVQVHGKDLGLVGQVYLQLEGGNAV